MNDIQAFILKFTKIYCWYPHEILSPNYKNYQPVISLLESMLSEDTGQKLIAVQNRGGLSAVNTSIQHLFLKVEEKFRQQTTFDNIRKIDIARITSDLISNQDVISYFNTHYDTSGIRLEKEIKKNLLENMIKLFCRVRSFSLAKDITEKHRQILKAKKSKGLRKSIKKATETVEE